MTNKRKVALLGIGFAIVVTVIIIVALRVGEAYREERNMPDLKMHMVDRIPGEDSSLFSDKYKRQLKVDFSWLNIYRQVSFILLDEQYQLIMAKDSLARNVGLPDLVHLTKGNGRGTVMIPYKPERLKDHGRFEYRLGPEEPINNIFLIYSGERAEVLVANDSVLQYHLSCSNVAIRYAADSPVDIFLENGDDPLSEGDLHIDIVLVKRQNTIYFLFILPINYKNYVNPIFAGELLKE